MARGRLPSPITTATKKDLQRCLYFILEALRRRGGDAPARQVWVEEVRELGLIIHHLLIDPAYIRPIYI